METVLIDRCRGRLEHPGNGTKMPASHVHPPPPGPEPQIFRGGGAGIFRQDFQRKTRTQNEGILQEV